MKKLLTLAAALPVMFICFAQPPGTARINNLKDAWDEPVSYVGQVKNGKPNGLGTFLYRNDYALRYVGYFVDGKPSGKGALVFKNGAFLCGDWKNGKLGGKGANLNRDGDLFVGEFVNGVKSGFGTLFYKNNGFLQGSFANDALEGRAFYVDGSGLIFNDNIYKNDKKNGPGYQYELKEKKLFKGTWSDGKWVGPSTPYYTSFLTDSRFKAEQNTNQVLMGAISNSGKLQDTAYYRDLIKKRRYFGVFDNGRFRKGFFIREDTSIFLGSINEQGSQGPGSMLKRGKFYDEGTYLDDYLNGPQNLSIDLEKKSVYYGAAANKGQFTGKAWFSNAKGVLYNGDYLEGKFTGTGWRLDTLGFCTGGTWEKGTLTKFGYATLPSGKAINPSPATLAESVSQLMDMFDAGYDPVQGSNMEDWSLGVFDAINSSYYRMLPGTRGNFIGEYSDDIFHFCIVYQGTDSKAASAKYSALCKQLAALTITGKGVPMKLTTEDKMVPEDEDKAVTYFALSPDKNLRWIDFNLMMTQVYNEDSGEFVVMFSAGSALSMEDWLDNY